MSANHMVIFTPTKAPRGGAIVIARGSVEENRPVLERPVIWLVVESVRADDGVPTRDQASVMLADRFERALVDADTPRIAEMGVAGERRQP
jgi:hypothetical protein